MEPDAIIRKGSVDHESSSHQAHQTQDNPSVATLSTSNDASSPKGSPSRTEHGAEAGGGSAADVGQKVPLLSHLGVDLLARPLPQLVVGRDGSTRRGSLVECTICLSELLELERAIQKQIDEGGQDNMFPKRWHSLALAFRTALAESRPLLTWDSPLQRSRDPPSSEMPEMPILGIHPRRGHIPVIDLDSESEGDPQPGSVIKLGMKRSHPLTQSTPGRSSRIVPLHTHDYHTTSRCFSLSEVRDIIRDAYIGLPNQTHPKAIERMIRLSQEHWHKSAQQFLSHCRDLCEAMVLEQVLKVFGHHQQTKAYKQLLGICETFFEEAFVYQRQVAKDILHWELSKPTSFNSEAMRTARDQALAFLQARRGEARATAYLDKQEAKSGKITTGRARINKLSKLIDDRTLPPEKYTQEIMAMSVVKGYYECSYNRFAETLFASTRYNLFSQCAVGIAWRVRSAFGLPEAAGHAAPDLPWLRPDHCR